MKWVLSPRESASIPLSLRLPKGHLSSPHFLWIIFANFFGTLKFDFKFAVMICADVSFNWMNCNLSHIWWLEIQNQMLGRSRTWFCLNLRYEKNQVTSLVNSNISWEANKTRKTFALICRNMCHIFISKFKIYFFEFDKVSH